MIDSPRPSPTGSPGSAESIAGPRRSNRGQQPASNGGTSRREVAETLDIAPATFSQHLRTAERKLVDAVLEDEPELEFASTSASESESE
nr:helix-turn-helix domain-containing protein [Halosolutus halophilus]